ncbi:OB-fold nucleic acid binding domain-containing protein [Agilicoccus flavus]|uniref:OB-fold nucleic acid binding domain-containing protein n=1 Tax=Agilicoccus flavus TaxID=2775968 RepID=UPI001CF657E3|nr:OB-fold nucleic acid binding domain-containing protein [Agilicoccus flavus]
MSRLLHRLSAPSEELETDEIVDRCRASHTNIGDLADRSLVDVVGVVRALTFPPRQRVPELVADLSDGTGTLVLVWLGRRSIRGIEPGTLLRVRGRVCLRRGRPTVFNPAYELLPEGSGGAPGGADTGEASAVA